MTQLKHTMRSLAHHAGEEINEQLGLPIGYDQSRGNRCDLLTYHVLRALEYREMEVRRELHMNENGSWHYILAHAHAEAEPTETDLMSDLNPWQGRDFSRGMLHLPRAELMEQLRVSGANESFVALRSLSTIVRAHDTRLNPSR